MIIDIIAFSLLASVIVLLLITNLRSISKRKELVALLLQQTMDKSALLEHVKKLTDESQANSIEQSEGFLKFVSQSRDWAFDYIEEVQAELEKFSNKVGPDIKYIVKYGTLIEHPLQASINRIAEAYTELEKLLPQDKDQV